MKLTVLFAVAVLIGGGIYLAENEEDFKITVDLVPNTVNIGEMMSLKVTIIPLQQIKGEFEIEIKPENPNYVFLHKEDAVYDPEKQSWIINLGKMDLEVGMDRPYIYHLSGYTDISASTWKVDVFVRYKPEDTSKNLEEHYETKYFTVVKPEVPISFWQKARQFMRRKTGYCLGTEVIVLFVCTGALVSIKKRKRIDHCDEKP